MILAPGHVFFDPIKRPRTEKQHALFVTFPDDRGLTRLEIDGGALQRQRFRYPRTGAEEHFDQRPEAQPVHIIQTRPIPEGNCRYILLDLVGRQELHFPLGYARQADLTTIQNGRPKVRDCQGYDPRDDRD